MRVLEVAVAGSSGMDSWVIALGEFTARSMLLVTSQRPKCHIKKPTKKIKKRMKESLPYHRRENVIE